MPANLSISVTGRPIAPAPETSSTLTGIDASKTYASVIQEITAGALESQLIRTLLPAHGEVDLIGSGESGFRFNGFPDLVDGDSNPVGDYNGIPLKLAKLYGLMFCVKLIDTGPAGEPNPIGGKAKLSFINGAGNSYSWVAEAPGIFMPVWSPTPITPDEAAVLSVSFEKTTAATVQDVNALVEILLLGETAPPAP